MKLQCVALFGLGLFVLQANAVESVVIDSKMLGEQLGAATVDVNQPAQADAAASQAEANRERILKGGKMSARQKTAMVKAEIADSNKQEGEAFLAQNKIKPGVISLPSGVQYKILRESQGKKPTDGSVVACRYRGTLIGGTEFDKSDAKKPVEQKVAGFLRGLKEAVKLMSAGSKWQIVVPPHLGYGELGDRGVGPNAVLVYEMEIISVK